MAQGEEEMKTLYDLLFWTSREIYALKSAIKRAELGAITFCILATDDDNADEFEISKKVYLKHCNNLLKHYQKRERRLRKIAVLRYLRIGRMEKSEASQ
jgi:hypothetical protein